ncbi:MAG: ABC transporter ATP-binding protein [Clostridiales bacterium]|nr:ABC transporter ATP-binding protein [Clostridiales bacterium]
MGNERIYALNDVNVSIYPQEICCLLGKSGSGKSTLLNMIAGLEKPTMGEIIFHNKHIETMNENELAKFRQAYIGFVFQSYNLLPNMTAMENVMLPLIFKKIPPKERAQRAKEMLIRVGLEKRLYHKPSEMSGGQQQRVSIARAFINRPQVVFADEPTGNLDSRTTDEMMQLITGLAEKYHQTLIIVTHDEEISDYADTIIRLSDGKIEEKVKNQRKKTKEETQ